MSNLEPHRQLLLEWLFQHIDVPFPTSESQAGWKIYQSLSLISDAPSTSESIADQTIEWSWVSFHKMTVWFAQYFAAKASQDPKEQQFLIEFLTQIQISEGDPIRLFLLTDTRDHHFQGAGFVVTCEGQTRIVDFVGDVAIGPVTQLLESQRAD